MKNLGALKAVGYTSGQLIGSLLLQFLGLAFLAAIVGVGLSYSLFPAVNAMMISQAESGAGIENHSFWRQAQCNRMYYHAGPVPGGGLFRADDRERHCRFYAFLKPDRG